jgi:hypothetical protein
MKRNPKAEIRNPKEGRNPKSECGKRQPLGPEARVASVSSAEPIPESFAISAFGFRISDFGFPSDFGLRISAFVL